MARHKVHLSKISLLHYWKLFFRGTLFLLSTAIYINDRVAAVQSDIHFLGFITHPYMMTFIWIIFAAEMLLRFFPSQMESAGCQKVFGRNYKPAPQPRKPRDDRLIFVPCPPKPHASPQCALSLCRIWGLVAPQKSHHFSIILKAVFSLSVSFSDTTKKSK